MKNDGICYTNEVYLRLALNGTVSKSKPKAWFWFMILQLSLQLCLCSPCAVLDYSAGRRSVVLLHVAGQSLRDVALPKIRQANIVPCVLTYIQKGVLLDSFLYIWYSEPYAQRTIAHEIFELSLTHYDTNISKIIALIRDIKG